MKVILFFLLLAISETLFAQQWQWFHEIGSPEQDFAKAALDNQNNLYVFEKRGNNDCFLEKYSGNGDLVWSHQINNGINSRAGVADIEIDKNNSIYITGSFFSSVVLGYDTLISEGEDIFLAKYNSDGECVWSRKAGGSGGDVVNAFTVDENSNIFLTGAGSDSAFYGSIKTPSGGILAKYNSTGFCLWAKKVTELNASHTLELLPFTSMKVINGKLLLTATEWTSTFYVDTIAINHPSQHGTALCCFDMEGNIQWMQEGLSGIAYGAYNISSDNQNNIYTTGWFYKNINFSGVVLNAQTSNAGSSSYGIFIAKYNLSGNLIFAKDISIIYYPGSMGGRSNSIECDSIGNFYLTGCFNGTAAFGPDTVVSETYQDFFLARFSPGGDCYGAITFGAAEGTSVDIDPAGNPVVVGVTGLPSAMEEMNVFLAKGNPITGIEVKSNPNNRLVIYANPNEGICNVELPADFENEKTLHLTILNNQGQVIQSVEINNEQDNLSIDIRAEAKGIYNVILSNGKKSFSGKIIFQ